MPCVSTPRRSARVRASAIRVAWKGETPVLERREVVKVWQVVEEMGRRLGPDAIVSWIGQRLWYKGLSSQDVCFTCFVSSR